METTKIIKLIRKLVREEVRRVVKPLVNEVLAEQFIRVMGEGRGQTSSPLASALTAPPKQIDEDAADEARLLRRQDAERKALKERIETLTEGDPMAQLIYEGIDPGDRSAIHQSDLAGHIDDGGAGVDLSQFGL